MKIFDCHTHIERGFNDYSLPNVANKNIVFDSIDSYRKNRHLVNSTDVVSLIIDLDQIDYVRQEVENGLVNAIVIHARDQKLNCDDYAFLLKSLALFPDQLPVLIDSFYYGEDINHQPSLEMIIEFAKKYPKKKFVIEHSGGYEVLRYFFHLRPLNNIYYDLSFSLQYLYDSSCFLDIKKLIKYTDKTKIMYGSDYFWASPSLQLEILQSIFCDLDICIDDQKLILYHNASNVFNMSLDKFYLT